MKKFIGLAALALCATVASAQDVYTTWGSSQTLTIKTTKLGLTSTTKNFPLLVRLTSAQSAIFAGSKGKGKDIRFVHSNMTTRLPHQIERWDSAGMKAEIWVLIDSIPKTGTTDIKMLWNKTGAADSSNGNAVFNATNGFVSVTHLGDSTGSNPRPNQVAGAPTAILRNFDSAQDFGVSPVVYTPVEGAVGLADQLRGGAMGANFGATRDYIDLGHRAYAGFSDFSGGFFFSTWMNVTISRQYERFLEMNDDTVGVGQSGERIILFGNHTTAAQNISVRWGSNGLTFNEPNGSLYAAGTWTQVAFSKPSGSSPIDIWVNGRLVVSTDPADDPTVALRDYVALGRSAVTQGDQYFYGAFDEAVIAKTSRTADWITLSYATQRPGVSVLDTAALPSMIGNHAQTAASQAFASTNAGQSVQFILPASKVAGRLTIVDVWGRSVWSTSVAAGASHLVWNAKAGVNARGVYVARFTAGSTSLLHKFTYNP